MSKSFKQLLDTTLYAQQSWKLELLGSWSTIVGNLHDKVHIEKVLDDTVILGVYDSCWMQELHMLSDVLLRLINQRLDQPRIKHLRFRKSIKKIWRRRPTAAVAAQEKKEIPPLKYQENQALNAIKDSELRAALYTFLVRCYQEK